MLRSSLRSNSQLLNILMAIANLVWYYLTIVIVCIHNLLNHLLLLHLILKLNRLLPILVYHLVIHHLLLEHIRVCNHLLVHAWWHQGSVFVIYWKLPIKSLAIRKLSLTISILLWCSISFLVHMSIIIWFQILFIKLTDEWNNMTKFAFIPMNKDRRHTNTKLLILNKK